MEKVCIDCGQLKPLSEFYRHPHMTDGHLNSCKSCRCAYRANRVQTLALDPAWIAKEAERHRAKALRQYHQRRKNDPTYQAEHQKYVNAWQERHPERRRAHVTVRTALRAGRLQRQPCEVCADPKSEAHHDDYSRPLAVRWLCRRHHGEVHRLDKAA